MRNSTRTAGRGGPTGSRARRTSNAGRTTPRVLAVSLGAALAATAGASPGAASSQAEQVAHHFPSADFVAQDRPIRRLTSAVQMTKKEPAPGRAFTGPASMLADPDDPNIVVAATADLRTRVCHLLVSRDAGRTWDFSESLPSPESHPFCTNSTAGVPLASIAWGRDGTIYYAMQGYDGEGESPREGKTSILVARSTDLGDTWRSTVVADGLEKIEGFEVENTGVSALAVDMSGDRDVVHVGFARSYADVPDDSPRNDPSTLVATSTDGGATFDPPVDLNEFSEVTQEIDGKAYPLRFRTGFGAPFMTAHDGVLLVVAGSQTPFDDRPPPPPAAGEGLSPGSFYAVPHPQLVARSTDQGRTWSVSTLGPPIYAGAGAFTGLGWTPEGGPQGSFVAVYAGSPETSPTTGIADLVFQRSTDGGRTWSDPVAIDDDDPEDYSTSFYPQLSVAPNGRIDVVFQDNRGQTDYRFNVQYTYSTDGGATWAPNRAINDRPVDFNFGVSFNSDLRYPPGVASTDHYATFGWADARLADKVTQTQDNFGAVAQFSALPAGSSSVLRFAVAAFGGLLAAGLVLLLLSALRKKDDASPPPPAAPPRQPEPVGAGER